MARYRLKPLEVDAVQFQPGVEHPLIKSRPSTMSKSTFYWVETDAGACYLDPGNWIIQYHDGRVFVVENTTFGEFFENSPERTVDESVGTR